MIVSRAPGRVNIIGDHTDYTGGLVLPMAIDLATTIRATRTGTSVRLESDARPEAAEVPVGVEDPTTATPSWARYVAGVVAELRPVIGLNGLITTTLPVGAGLSSSAALEVAVALALGARGSPQEVAQLCQRAEQRASGVPCGIMDQLTVTSGIEGSLVRIDCRSLQVRAVVLPDDVAVVAVHSGQARSLAGSEYAARRADCERAEALIGPLRHASPADVDAIRDPVLRRRARHVVTENGRVDDLVEALAQRDYTGAGQLLSDSHRSLRDDFDVSTPVVDATVDRLRKLPGVWGARMTGGGFGGVVVAVCDAGAPTAAGPDGGWRLRPSAGAAAWEEA